MDILQRQIRSAQRRLALQRFIGLLAWCLFGTLVVAALAVAAIKIWPLEVDGRQWTAAWAGGALALGVLTAAVWTYATRGRSLDAAIEIDRRFGLKERVSSTLALTDIDRDSEAGQALLADTVRRVDRLDVSTKFAVAPQRRALLPLLPAAIVVALIFVADKGTESQALAKTDAENIKKQIAESTEPLRKKMAEQQKEAKDKGLKDAEEIFRKIEEGTRDLADKSGADRKQALVKLNDLAAKLEERRKQLGGDDKLKQQLDQLKNLRKGPADAMADAMRKGDFQKAIDEVKKLQEQLAKQELDPEKKAELAEQLADMKQKLEKMADAHKQAEKEMKKQADQLEKSVKAEKDKLQKQIDEAKQQGDQAQADRLKKELDKLAQNPDQQQLDKLNDQLQKMAERNPQMDALKKMAEQMGDCAQCMKDGQGDGAKDALDKLQQQLSKMQRDADESKMLDQAMDQIAQAKQQMNCKQCNGGGCKACQGQGQRNSESQGQGKSDKIGMGQGLGEGQAYGRRPEEKTKTGTRDTKVGQNVREGGSVIKDLVDGPNIKGQVQQEIRNEMEASKRESADALTGQRLPRNQRDHVKEYFENLHKGGK